MKRLFDDVAVESLDPTDIQEEPLDMSEDMAYQAEVLADSSLTPLETSMSVVVESQRLLDSKEKGSVPYFVALENIKISMAKISKDLGIYKPVPSLEDFNNPYGLESCHSIAMEGFYDWVKSIWEKIAKFFHDFFKKTMIFFKRLAGYELDLTSYEKYVEAAIIKIKSRKLELTADKKPVKSRLPSLLADEGMSTMTVEYLFTRGEEVIKNINKLLSDKGLLNGIKIMGKNSIPALDTSIKVLAGSLNTGSIVSIDDLNNQVADIRKIATDSIKGIYPYQTEFNNLPEDAYRAVSHQFDSREMAEGTQVHSLTDHSAMRLPKNFNSYFLNYDDQKVFVASSSERPALVKDELDPISTVENLVTLYDTYKKDIRSVNTKQVSDATRGVEKSIEEFTNTMKREFTKILETASSKSVSLDELNDKVWNTGLSHALLSEVNTISREYIPEGENITGPDGVYKFAKDKPDFDAIWTEYSSRIGKVLEGARVNVIYTEVGISKVFKDVLTNLQGFLVSLLTAIQVALRDITVKVIAVQTEVRYELIRFLYNSSAQYK